MQDKLTLMIPGPTPVPETVLKAMGRHPIGHLSLIHISEPTRPY